MAFGNQAGSVRAYAYGCTNPTEGREAAQRQSDLRIELWNRLVELELARRGKVEALFAPILAEFDAIADEKEREKARRTRRRELFKLPEMTDALAALEREKVEAARPLYTGSELYSWNTDDVLANWRAACRKGPAPRFHRRAARTGTVTLRWQTGLPVGEADARMQLLPHPDARTGKPFYQLRFRVATEERKPVWCVLGVVLHRPLPEGGVIRRATLKWEPRAGHTVYRLVLIVAEESATVPAAPERTCALDVGWRLRPDGVRVGYWLGDDGQSGELQLPEDWLREQERVDRIQGERKTQFNAARDALAEWLRGVGDAPEWLVEATATLRRWLSPARLATLEHRWRESRWHGDEAGYELVSAWRKRDRHLWEFERHLDAQLLDRRKHLYREFAAWLGSRYRTLLIEDFDLRSVTEHKQQAKDLPAPVRYRRTLAAISELRLILENAFQRRGGTVARVAAQHTTQTCADCGQLEPFDAAAELVHTCRQCGATWDQDRNACRWLLRGGVPAKPKGAVGQAPPCEGPGTVPNGNGTPAPPQKRKERKTRGDLRNQPGTSGTVGLNA